MNLPRKWLRPGGLAFRITVTYAVGACVVSLAVALSAYAFSQRFQVNSQENEALRQTYLNAATARARLLANPVDIPLLLDALTTGSSTSTLIYHDERWYTSSLVKSRDALPAEFRRTTIDGSVSRVWTNVAHHPLFVVGVPLPAVHGAYFQTFDEIGLAHNLSVLRTILLAAVSATTVAGALLGWWASRRLTSPLRAVASAARRLSEGDLQTRLPDHHDRELTGLVDSFNSMVETLQARIQRDATFAGNVSHELRSPLTTLATSLAVLESRRADMPSRATEALDLLSDEVGRFERLVDDLLEISRAEGEDAITEPQPIVIGQLVVNFAAATGREDLPIKVDAEALDAIVLGDKRRLHQVLRNLVENAERYAGGVQEVRVISGPTAIRIYVDDAGPGVPPDERDRIFDRFARGRATSRASSHGSGLGLALVKEHARAHHGSVWVTDSPSGGARFALELPRGKR